ncbi:MAG TPA: universal stress protein [Acidimicrobiales bacterium]|nr:universal stress protein [Acidimicrobiales bacterium]
MRDPEAVPVVELGRGESGAEPSAALVVGFDRSAASRAALETAAELGRRLGAEIHVLHAIDLADYPVDPDADDWETQAAKSLEEERGIVAAALAGYPHGWFYSALRAEPAEALNRVAERVDALMIVVGVRSHGWRHLFERLAGPSVSHRLMNHTHRPVLVVSNV